MSEASAGGWAIVANVADPRSTNLRRGALVWVVNTNPGNGSDRIQVFGLSTGGRRIVVWIASRCLVNVRIKWTPIPKSCRTAWDQVLIEPVREDAAFAALGIAQWVGVPRGRVPQGWRLYGSGKEAVLAELRWADDGGR